MKIGNEEASEIGLQIQLFGAFDVRIDGVPISPLRSRKVQWLLALLVLRHNQTLDRVWLAGTFWPESAPAQAMYNLRQSLSNLRHALGDARQCLHASMVNALSFEISPQNVDVITFDAAVVTGDRAALERAVTLYRGPLLEGCAEEWVFSERRVREESYLSALEKLAEMCLTHGEGREAIKYLRTAIQTDPFRERAQRTLIQALASVGDFGAAVQTYRDLRLLLHSELNTDPDPETVALFQRIRCDARRQPLARPTLSADMHTTPSRKLPSPLTALVGRKSELEQIISRLRTVRLLTLTGPGGVGKTRLAIAVANAIEEDYQDGVFFVDLAPLSDPVLVAKAVAVVLQVREKPGQSLLLTLQAQLQSKTILLVLDNCEHLLDYCADLADTLLRHCSGVSILATSRQGLGLTGEVGWVVSPLTTPALHSPTWKSKQSVNDWEALLKEYEAVQLFVIRAQQAQPSFQISAPNAKAVAQICAQLDGIPLALELAAARIRSLAVEDINSKLDNRFRLLTKGSRTALPRQQTLRALMDWSYDLLNDEEKALLCRLSVFAGGWALEAAEQICTGKILGAQEDLEEWDILDVLTNLTDKSLVVYEEQAGVSRYRLLETVRQYARDRLVESGEADIWRKRHLDYFLRLGKEAKEKLIGAEQAEWLQRLETEHDNLRAALDFCLNASEAVESGMELAGALQQFWCTHGHVSEGRERLEAMLTRPGAQEPTRGRAIGLNTSGSLAWMQGDYNAARFQCEESLALGRRLGDKKIISSTLSNLGSIANLQGDYASARFYFEESLAIQRDLENKRGIALSLLGLGNVAMEQGDYTAARALNEESLALGHELGDKRSIARSLLHLGNVFVELNDPEGARPYYEGSLAIQSALGDKRGMARSLNNLGNVAMNQGDYTIARSHLEESLAIQKDLGDKGGFALALCNLGSLLGKEGEYSAAQASLNECLKVCQELGDKWITAHVLEGSAKLACQQQQAQRCARLYGAAHALRLAIGSPLSPHALTEQESQVAMVKASIDEEEFVNKWAEGEAMKIEEAIRYTLTGSL